MRGSLIALLLLAGCTAHQAPASSIIFLMPPYTLLEDCAHAPRPAGKAIGDLAQALIDEREQLDRCNADKAALRAWKSGVNETRSQRQAWK
ncbi:Rz1-like lysis system protein LysC [Mycetohabitans sp. B46]|uniref:Rz1-like lysis system protein LysC n=1 Tax=Mycetohabitans sp. B46 TaxID=2772536 RepID=UPI003FD156EA